MAGLTFSLNTNKREGYGGSGGWSGSTIKSKYGNGSQFPSTVKSKLTQVKKVSPFSGTYQYTNDYVFIFTASEVRPTWMDVPCGVGPEKNESYLYVSSHAYDMNAVYSFLGYNDSWLRDSPSSSNYARLIDGSYKNYSVSELLTTNGYVSMIFGFCF